MKNNNKTKSSIGFSAFGYKSYNISVNNLTLTTDSISYFFVCVLNKYILFKIESFSGLIIIEYIMIRSASIP